MDTEKHDLIQAAHARLHADYLSAHTRLRDSIAALTRIEAAHANDLDEEDERGAARAAAARRGVDRARGEVAALAVRLRASRALLDKLNAYAAIHS